MAIYRQLERSPFGPEEIAAMKEAFEHLLRALGIDLTSATAEIIASKIITIAQTGQKDPAIISAQVMNDLGVPPGR